MILVIDNYDSFVFNLARYFEILGEKVITRRNDSLNLQEIVDLNPSHIVISPGPSGPIEAGISIKIVEELHQKIPILGVCLGHQVIGHVFGGAVIRAKKPMHGKYSLINHGEEGVFKHLPNPLKVGRYHSLIVDEAQLANDIVITSRSLESEIMSLQHKYWPVVGLQFHPESILTDNGLKIIENFLNLTHINVT